MKSCTLLQKIERNRNIPHREIEYFDEFNDGAYGSVYRQIAAPYLTFWSLY
jgi:hypothetical protein